MKKTLLTLSMMLITSVGLVASTTTYTETIDITMNGESLGSQQATILVEKLETGTANFTLKNFTLGVLPVGTIKLQGATVNNIGYDKLSFCDSISIENGDNPEVGWMGPFMGKIPVLMKAKIHGSQLIAHLDIDLGETGQVHVAVGNETASSTKTYTNQNIQIKLYGEDAGTQQGDIIVETLEDGEINFALNNFILTEMQMPVGNIALKDINVTVDHNCKTFTANESILITAGTTSGIETWMGPALGFIPLQMTGKVAAENLYVNIIISMGDMPVNVIVGADFDGIENVEATSTSSASNAIYTLNGCRVAKMTTSGIYIVNGKKVLR